jgi:hypothetical protein
MKKVTIGDAMNNIETILLRLIKLNIATGKEIDYVYRGDYDGRTLQTRGLQSERYTYRRYRSTQDNAPTYNQRVEKP